MPLAKWQSSGPHSVGAGDADLPRAKCLQPANGNASFAGEFWTWGPAGQMGGGAVGQIHLNLRTKSCLTVLAQARRLALDGWDGVGRWQPAAVGVGDFRLERLRVLSNALTTHSRRKSPATTSPRHHATAVVA